MPKNGTQNEILEEDHEATPDLAKRGTLGKMADMMQKE